MLFFIHIPKAAGTSLREALAAGLQDRLVQIYEDHPGKSRRDALARDLPDDAVIYGHFTYGIHEMFGAAPRYATVLRHPVSRLMSWYSFHASNPRLPFFQDTRRASLPELLHERKIKQLMNNMTKYVSGRDPRSLDDEEVLEIAKRNLQEFHFVSTQEDIQDDIPALARMFGVKIRALDHLNKTSNKKVSADWVDDIMQFNKLDMELYDFACRLRARSPAAHQRTAV